MSFSVDTLNTKETLKYLQLISILKVSNIILSLIMYFTNYESSHIGLINPFSFSFEPSMHESTLNGDEILNI